MSRIGRQPIQVPAGVLVSVDPGRVTVSGPKGELRTAVPQRMKIEQEEGVITVSRPTERGDDRALHGLTRTLVANMVDTRDSMLSQDLKTGSLNLIIIFLDTISHRIWSSASG